MTTFFTADTHFGHAKIIEHSKRPFASIEEMDEMLIQNWNKTVSPKDDVWHLGDFNFKSSKSTHYYRNCLNGHVHIVYGNHDDKYAKRAQLIAQRSGHTIFSTEQEVKYLRLNDERITLYHYAQRVWRNSHHGAWHLFGHSHNGLPRYHRSMDVGVDACNYTPISFDEIKVYMDTQVFTLHHPELVTDPWNKEPSESWKEDGESA
jgi:calcineurin-like phosphoesterase family protein